MSQFAFLEPEFAMVFDHARKAEGAAIADPRAACFYARLALETAIKWMYAHDRGLRSPYDEALSALIHEPTFRTLVGPALVTKAKLIKDLGNRAVHETRAVPPQAATTAIRELFHFSYWLVHTYARGTKPPTGLQFSAESLPHTAQVEATTLARLQAIARDYAEKAKAQAAAEAARLKTQEQRDALEAQIAQLQAEIAAIKEANQAIPDTHDYNEAETRDAFVDLLLREAGWPLDQPRDKEFPVTGMPNPTGQGFVDNVLWGDDGKPLASVETKRTRRDARVGQQQVKIYTDCLEAEYAQRPVMYYTNGYEHWLWDDQRYPPRQVQGFMKKDELMLLHQRRTSRKRLADVAIDSAIVDRFYQTRAIRRLNETFEQDNLRKALLVAATGVGKTRIVVAAVDQLMRANWAKRTLFLADRRALVRQAVNAFKTHLPQSSPVNLLTDKQGEGRVFVATYQTMMRLIEEETNGVRRFGVGHFDLIVIDEAHRSVYRKYRAIFDWFDSLLIGLTATPRDEIDRDTYALFDLERGVPTDAYDLEQAVKDGYLVPPVAVSVPLKFQREGIKYNELSEEEKTAWDALEWSEDGPPPDEVGADALNKWLFNQDTVDKVLKHLMTNGLKVDHGDRLGKTIVFAKNHEHAQFIAERFDHHYPHLKGHFARVIDFRTEYADTLIDDFSDPAKSPQIAISVDMLDTGIDVPEVVNLVFFKIVRSKTKFWQMIGRGTRLCPDLFGPGQDKECFRVFDFCQNFEFFGQEQKPVEVPLNATLGERLFATRVRLIGAIDTLGLESERAALTGLRQNLADGLHAEVLGMSLDNFIVRPKRRSVERFQASEPWERLSPADCAELIEHLAGLPSALVDEDLAARQFDHLVLSTQLAVLRAEPGFNALRERITAIASQLEELGKVPMVKAQLAFIAEVQTEEYWQDITLPLLDDLRRRLRALVKLIEPKRRNFVYSDFEDEIGEESAVYLPGVGPGIDKGRFMRKVRAFLDRHADHLTIRKLKHNEPLTPLDLKELERFFVEEAVGDSADLERIRTQAGGLGLFIRTLVGLDREAAKQALSGFTVGRRLSANQIEFIDLVIDHLTGSGIMEPDRLYESPFTDIDHRGVSGLFPAADVKVLVGILNDVRNRAAA